MHIKIDTLPLSSSCAGLTLAAEIVTYLGAHVRSSLLRRFLFVVTLPIEQVPPLCDFLSVACASSCRSRTLNKYSAGLVNLGVEFPYLLSCYSFPNLQTPAVAPAETRPTSLTLILAPGGDSFSIT